MSLNRNYQTVEKHLKKMIRKMLMLIVEQSTYKHIEFFQKQQNINNILTEKFPSYLHVATIMNERTQEEKENFGSINFNERFAVK